MRKNNPASASGQNVPVYFFVLTLVLRALCVLLAAFCLYRLCQLLGGNNIALSGREIVVQVQDAGGKTVYTSPDLRELAGKDPQSVALEDGYACQISAQRNARKKFIQVSLTLTDADGQTVFQAEQEPLQFTEEVRADITLAASRDENGALTAQVTPRVSEVTHIDHYLMWYLLGLAIGIAGLIAVGLAARPFRQNTGIARFSRTAVAVSRYVLLAVILVVALFPILWMLFASLLPSQRVMQIPPVLGITSESSFANYIKVFSQAKYLKYYLNSIITASGTVAVVMLIALLASYSFSRYSFAGKNAVLTLIMSVQMFPIVAILISLYGFYMRWNLVDNYFGVILADTVQALPLAIMLLRSFFDTLPRSLDESARIDGAGRIRTMMSILVPLTVPGLIAVGIYTFLNAWDDYLMSLTIMKKDVMKTLPVGLAQSFLGEYAHDYGALMAFAMGGSLPIVLMFIFFQKYMISGLTAGAVKG